MNSTKTPIDAAAVASPEAFDQAAGVAAEGATGQPPQPEGAVTGVKTLLGFEEWYATAAGFFGIGATKINALSFDPGAEEPRKAFKALYDTCLDVPALRWLLMPGGIWFQRLVSIGAFFVPMAVAVRTELAARPKKPKGVAAAANDTTAPIVPPHLYAARQAEGPTASA